MSQNFIIAIDGPAGSGKSTSAKMIARKLGFLYIDTGAMYRAVTYMALKKGIIDDLAAVSQLARQVNIDLNFVNGKTYVKADGTDITEEIRTVEVNSRVSDVSKIAEVRKALVEKQQIIGRSGNGVVMEGRDITTVVFPDADVKIFLTADIEKRSERRLKEYSDNGTDLKIDEVKDNLIKRDRTDSTRSVSPLKKAEDAVEVDTSDITIDQQVSIILGIIREKASHKGINIRESEEI